MRNILKRPPVASKSSLFFWVMVEICCNRFSKIFIGFIVSINFRGMDYFIFDKIFLKV